MDAALLLADATRLLAESEPGEASAKLHELFAARGMRRLEDAPETLRSPLRHLLGIAEARAAEHEELLRARERAQMLSEASFEGIMVHVDGSIIDANQRLGDLVGYEPAELLGPATFGRCVAPQDQPMVAKRMRDRVEGEYLITAVRKDGSTFRAELLTKQGKLGARPVRIAAVRDVTERERTSELLRESEARLRDLAQTAFDVLVYSRDGIIVEVVGKVEQPLGFSKLAMVGRRIVDLVTPSQRENTRSRIDGGTTGGYVTDITNDRGEIVPVEVVAVMTTLNGIPTRLAGIRDLREAKRAEAERREFEQHLQQAQRLDSLGVLAGGIAHDFNNLLVGIIGGAELLSLAELSPEDRDSVNAILEGGQRAATLTAQLLAYAGRRDLGQREPIDLRVLVSELRRLLGATLSKKARLEVSIAAGSVVLGNRATILQVLMNLLTNASDALGGEPGSIIVRAERVREPGERFKHALGALVHERATPWILIQVTDTGVGMDQPTKARIFEPFFSTKAKGHGLGLAACLGIVSSHGGAIHVDSAPGQGSTFSVLLPAADAPSPKTDVGSRPNAAPGRLLVVDDEQIVRTQVRRMVEAHGYSVIEASDGRAALALLERETVDLVLLDVTMPELDGTEVVREARARGHRVPIVLISGYADFPLETRLEPGTYNGFLAKPFKLDDLIATIKRVLEAPA
jgi:two-component system, cell cycle sensor histidine kinase and response regulator CckA